MDKPTKVMLANAINTMANQVLIVLTKRAGGRLSIPVEEIDDTGQDLLTIEVIDRVFHFTASKKH